MGLCCSIKYLKPLEIYLDMEGTQYFKNLLYTIKYLVKKKEEGYDLKCSHVIIMNVGFIGNVFPLSIVSLLLFLNKHALLELF